MRVFFTAFQVATKEDLLNLQSGISEKVFSATLRYGEFWQARRVSAGELYSDPSLVRETKHICKTPPRGTIQFSLLLNIYKSCDKQQSCKPERILDWTPCYHCTARIRRSGGQSRADGINDMA